MKLHTLSELKYFKNKRVLLRVDFNIPQKKGALAELFRIEKTIPTIKHLLKGGAGVVIVSHLGRPKGFDAKLTLKPVAAALGRLLGTSVQFIPFKNETSFAKAIAYLNVAPGSVVLLENVRFLADEEKNTGALARQLAHLADYFVSDCFAVAHRSSASITGVAKLLPSFAGFLMESEVTALTSIRTKPKKPLTVLLGGAKAETKIGLIQEFLPIAEYVLVTGGIANTYWASLGHKIGASIIDKEKMAIVKKLCINKNVYLPIDVVVGDAAGKKARVEFLSKQLRLKKTESIFDIGPATVRYFSGLVKKSRSVLWNGAPGKFEVHPYEYGTYALAQVLAARSKGKTFGVVGGGETVQVVRSLGLLDDFDFVSTGGGAMLEFLGGKMLPGVAVVTKK